MKKMLCVVGTVLLGFGAKYSFADPVLTDVLFNVNGSTTEGSFAITGMNTSGYNTSTGLGTLVYTYNPGTSGTSFFDVMFDLDINSAAFFNEYGTRVGTAGAGFTWEIGDYSSTTPPDVFDDTANNTLGNVNLLPGQTSNYSGSCSGPTCNGDAALAMGYSFTLGSAEEEIITMNLSTTAPASGFYLDQTHPVDPADSTRQDVYFTMSATTKSTGTPPPVPEPATWMMLATGLGAGLTRLRSKLNF
jgi:hypothetical protein